jgi:LmbE family N-acetylglucosaminyl deacetylase
MITLGQDTFATDIERVLCLGAHADDIEIGCGGTLLKLLAARGGRVSVDWVVFSADERRKAEAVRSAESFLRDAKEANVRIEGFRSSYFPYVGGEVKDFFERLADEGSPDLVFTHHRDDLHQDHRVIAELTWNTYRDHLILEYEIPKYDGDLGRPNVFVPLDRPQCDRKIALLLEGYPSQADKPWFTEDTFRAVLRLRGVESRAPSGFAEAFHGRKLVLA